MDWYEPEVRALEAARAKRQKSDEPPVFYGSSTIRLWQNLTSDLKCPDLLNLGFGGSTLAACVYFFDRLVAPENPRSLALYAGDNDLGDGCSAQEVIGFFDQMLEKVSETLQGRPFGFISVKPSPARVSILDRIKEVNRSIADRIEVFGQGAFFINVFDSMLSPVGEPRPDLFQEDGLHMNEQGYQLWTDLLQPFRDRIFKQT